MGILSDKPVRKGATYCAPCCGDGCTWAAYQVAKKAAAALAKHIGSSWTGDAWENMGWHYRVLSSDGKLKIYPNKYRGKITTYTAFLGEYSCGGSWTATHKNPKQAVKDVIQAATKEVVATLTTILEILPC